jgi:hypothetical protein
MPLTLYSLEEAQREIRKYTGHLYIIKALKKALDEERLGCKWAGKSPVIADDDVRDFVTGLSKYRITEEEYWRIRLQSEPDLR